MSPRGPFFDGLEELGNRTRGELAVFLRVLDLLRKGGLDLELELLFRRFGCLSPGDEESFRRGCRPGNFFLLEPGRL